MDDTFNGYCLIHEKNIDEGTCVEIVHELMGLKKEEHLKSIKKFIRANKSNDDIYNICKKCSNAPQEWRE